MNKTFTWRLLTPGELTDVYLQEMRPVSYTHLTLPTN